MGASASDSYGGSHVQGEGTPGVTGRRANRGHATSVALAATAVVMACYAVAVVGLYAVVSERLTHEVDARLATVLASAQRWTLPEGPVVGLVPASHENDVDDAPSFVWRVAPTGAVAPLTVGAPALPRRAWSAGPTSLDLGAAQFRFDVARRGSGWLVAGQSITEVGRVRAALWVPVLVFGVLLALAVFVGSLVVGLRASAPLEEVRRRQAEFTADASHELRTPLSVIEAEVELALSEPQDADEYVGVLRRVAGEGRRLRRIVDDLLWLARADRDPSAPPPGGPTDLVTAVAACTERFRGVAETRGVTLGVEGAAGPPVAVPVEADLLDRLCGVLVDNACKFAGDGGRVDVAVRSAGTRAGLLVDDSGPGIAPEDRPFIFDRFHRADDSLEGTGLGLAIADSVVRATRGSWVVGEAPSGGARMEVWWPRASTREDRPPPPNRTAPPAGPKEGSVPTPAVSLQPAP